MIGYDINKVNPIILRMYFGTIAFTYFLSSYFHYYKGSNIWSVTLRILTGILLLVPIFLSFRVYNSELIDYSILSSIFLSTLTGFYLIYYSNFTNISELSFIIKFTVHSLGLVMFVRSKLVGKLYFGSTVLISFIFLMNDLNVETLLISAIVVVIALLGFISHRYKLNSEREVADISANFETIIANSPFIYYMLDAKGTFILSRGKGLEKIGSKQDQVVGQNVYELYGGYEEMLNAISTAFQGKPSEHLSYVEEVDVYWSTKIIPIGSGDDIKLIGISIDVTPIIKSQQQIAESQLEIQRIQRLETIGTLSASIAHEFNNILTIYSSIAEVFSLDNSLSDSQEELIIDMIETTDRGKNLVNQLLTYARKDYQKFEVFELNGMINNMSKLIEIATKSKQIKLVFNLTEEKLVIKADKNAIHQVLLNLIINGIDSIEDEGEIRISTTKDEADEYVIIILEDTGTGIGNENLEKIFDPFFTTKIHGLGLGLSITQSIIHNLNGKIEVTSEISHGTKFTIYLPIEKVHVGSEIMSKRSLEFGEAELMGKTIMVVDDEIKITTLIEKILTSKGAKVLISHDGEEALGMATRPTNIDLIICDLKMPKMDGITFIKNLNNTKEINFNKPVIFLTGFMETNSIELSDILSEMKILSKPFLMEDLFKSINELLN